MHPDRRFAWGDEGELRAFVREVAFAQIVASVDGRPLTAQAPLVEAADGSLLFHLARTNALTPHLDGAAVLASVLGDHWYVSPDWYGTPDQVPTWNYRLVEVEGRCRRLDGAELVAQVDALSDANEARLAPKPPWTRAKMSPARYDALLRGIVGFAIEAPLFRGTRKLGQNKRAEEAAAMVAALRALGHERAAALTEAARTGGGT